MENLSKANETVIDTLLMAIKNHLSESPKQVLEINQEELKPLAQALDQVLQKAHSS